MQVAGQHVRAPRRLGLSIEILAHDLKSYLQYHSSKINHREPICAAVRPPVNPDDLEHALMAVALLTGWVVFS